MNKKHFYHHHVNKNMKYCLNVSQNIKMNVSVVFVNVLFRGKHGNSFAIQVSCFCFESQFLSACFFCLIYYVFKIINVFTKSQFPIFLSFPFLSLSFSLSIYTCRCQSTIVKLLYKYRIYSVQYDLLVLLLLL